MAAAADGVLLKVNFSAGELAPVTAVLGYLGAAGEAIGAAAPATSADRASGPACSTGTANSARRQPAKRPSKPHRLPSAWPLTWAWRSLPWPAPGPAARSPRATCSPSPNRVHPGAAAPLPGDLADAPSLSVRRAAAELNVNLGEVANGRPLSTLTKYDVLSAAASRAAGKEVKVEPAFPPPSALLAVPAHPSPSHPSPRHLSPRHLSPHHLSPPHLSRPKRQPSSAPAKSWSSTRACAPPSPRTRASAPSPRPMSPPCGIWTCPPSIAHRSAHKKEFAAGGVNLTLTAYFLEAILAGLRKVPAANATWTDDGVILKRYLQHRHGHCAAHGRQRPGRTHRAGDQERGRPHAHGAGPGRQRTGRARRGRTNCVPKTWPTAPSPSATTAPPAAASRRRSSSSPRWASWAWAPWRNGWSWRAAIRWNPAAGDALLVKPMTTLGFSYDHRVLDGATADAFCAAVKGHLEGYK